VGAGRRGPRGPSDPPRPLSKTPIGPSCTGRLVVGGGGDASVVATGRRRGPEAAVSRPASDRPGAPSSPAAAPDDVLVAPASPRSQAVEEGGGVPSDVADADALVWTDARTPVSCARCSTSTPGPVGAAAVGGHRAVRRRPRPRPALDLRQGGLRRARRRARPRAGAGRAASPRRLRPGDHVVRTGRTQPARRPGDHPRRWRDHPFARPPARPVRGPPHGRPPTPRPDRGVAEVVPRTRSLLDALAGATSSSSRSR
jgi:hypothetical protein